MESRLRTLQIHESRRQPDGSYSKEIENKLEERGSEIERLQQLLEKAESTRRQLEEKLQDSTADSLYVKDMEDSQTALESEKQEVRFLWRCG